MGVLYTLYVVQRRVFRENAVAAATAALAACCALHTCTACTILIVNE